MIGTLTRLTAFLTLALCAFGSVPAEIYAADDPEDEILARRLYRDAVAVAIDKPKRSAALFEEIVNRFPSSPWASRAQGWIGPNRIAAVEQLTENGPRTNRIDVAIMGDGFKDTYADKKAFNRICDDLLRHFFQSEVLAEYADYFNFYKVTLASVDDRVDYRKRQYDTALNGRKLGDDRHIAVDRGRVMHYLSAFEWNDRLSFAAVREGGLGTGGGGVATVGKDMGTVVIHEWGHAFADLADEYSREASPPGTPTRGPNVSNSPDPREAPWSHWHKKYPGKYKAHEGGAGVYKGVWRPTPDGCVMRAAHDFCPICREAIVRRIYSYVRPIDSMLDTQKMVEAAVGGERTHLYVFPIKPKSHRLDVEWSVVAEGDVDYDKHFSERWQGAMPGTPIKGDRNTVDKVQRYFVEIQSLKARRKIGVGRFKVFARVTDRAKVKGKQWVLKDPEGNLTQMVHWKVHVKAAPPKPPPAIDLFLSAVPLFKLGRFNGFDCTGAVHNRPADTVRFTPFDAPLNVGVRLGAAETASALDNHDRPLEIRPLPKGGSEVDARKVERFSLSWKKAVAGAAAAGQERNRTVIVNSGDLFFDLRGLRTGDIDLTVTLPKDWCLAVPWIDQAESWRIPSMASMERNFICLGDWAVRESLTCHVLLRTAVATRLEPNGRNLNSLFNKLLTAVGGMVEFPSGRVILVAADYNSERLSANRGDLGVSEGWRAVRGEDSLLFLAPTGFDPTKPDKEQQAALVELVAYEFATFFGPRPADGAAGAFLNGAPRHMALRAAAGPQTRRDKWYLSRAAEYLIAQMDSGTGNGATREFAVAFFLDKLLLRLAGEQKGLEAFMAELFARKARLFAHKAHFTARVTGAEDLTMRAILDSLSEFADFDLAPFWDRLTRRDGGPDAVSEFARCDLEIATTRDGPTLKTIGSR